MPEKKEEEEVSTEMVAGQEAGDEDAPLLEGARGKPPRARLQEFLLTGATCALYRSSARRSSS